jgi:hypothetical protein
MSRGKRAVGPIGGGHDQELIHADAVSPCEFFVFGLQRQGQAQRECGDSGRIFSDLSYLP